MSEFLERLREGPCLLLDGGLGSLLIDAGLPPGVPPERWVLEEPERIAAAHRAYVEAGSDAVHACTFGANPVRLACYGMENRCEEINAAAVRLARESGAEFVIADVGPTGEYLPPVGRGDLDTWREAFDRQVRSLVVERVDALHIETMTDLREARAALEVIRSLQVDVPVLASLTFERKKRGFFTAFGDPLVESLTTLAADGADGVGANCSITSAEMLELSMVVSGSVESPLVLQPNAGQPRVTTDGVRYDQPPDEFAASMDTLARQGVAAVGGCCGTDPRFIETLRRRMDARAGA